MYLYFYPMFLFSKHGDLYEMMNLMWQYDLDVWFIANFCQFVLF